MLRKIVSVGDPLDSNGIVLPNGNSTATMGGYPMALIGGSARCEQCKTIGQIAKSGGPRRLNFMGEVALEGDLVLCKYPVNPKLVSQLFQTANYDDLAETQGILPPLLAHLSGNESTPVDSPNSSVPSPQRFFELVDEITRLPLADRDYAITRENGRIEHGTASGVGNTHLLTLAAESEKLSVRLADLGP